MANETIVITRALGDEVELRDGLQDAGYHVICEPLTEIFLHHTAQAELANVLINSPDAVLITSQHGVQSLALLTELRDIPLLCVGEKTTEIAENLGFSRVCMAGENAERMIDYILGAYGDDARFLYVSGENISVDLGEILGISGMQVARVIAYEAVATEALSDTLLEQLKRGQIDAITFFSQRTAEIFLALAAEHNTLENINKIDAFCLSKNVAEVAENANWRKVYSANEPTLNSLIECIKANY